MGGNFKNVCHYYKLYNRMKLIATPKGHTEESKYPGVCVEHSQHKHHRAPSMVIFVVMENNFIKHTIEKQLNNSNLKSNSLIKPYPH